MFNHFTYVQPGPLQWIFTTSTSEFNNNIQGMLIKPRDTEINLENKGKLKIRKIKRHFDKK